jgi:molecular chaperone GrpE (heat shock protein)
MDQNTKQELSDELKSDIEEIWKNYLEELHRRVAIFTMDNLKECTEEEISEIIDNATESVPELSRDLQETALEVSK